MLTEREEAKVLYALGNAIQGKKIWFIVPNRDAVDKRIKFVMMLATSRFIVNLSESIVTERTSLGEVRFIATDHQLEKLKGLEFDGVFVDESEPVPEEVFTRVRKRNVKN